MRVLITGSSGFVGRAIAAELRRNGLETAGLDCASATGDGVVDFLEADITAEDFIDHVVCRLAPCQAIVHTAASLEPDPYSRRLTMVNGWGTQQVLRLASHWNAEQFLYLSSVPVIGRPVELPVTEGHPVNPLTAYHASKLYGEYLVRTTGAKKLCATVFRLTSPVGPGMQTDRILPVFAHRALAGQPLIVSGRGTRRQNYVDVRDIGSAVAAGLQKQAGGLFNIAGDRSISNLELARLCIRVAGSSSGISFQGDDPDEGVSWDISICKASKELGYRPRFPLEDSITALLAEYASRPHK